MHRLRDLAAAVLLFAGAYVVVVLGTTVNTNIREDMKRTAEWKQLQEACNPTYLKRAR